MRLNNLPDDSEDGTTEVLADALRAPGPFRDFRRGLSSPRWDPAPFQNRDLIYIALKLPKDAPWTADGLAEIRDEIVELSFFPEVARAYVDRRLSGPFAARMRERADAFADEMDDFYEDGFEVPAPSSERAVVLTAAFLRLYDAAVEASVASRPATGAFRLRLHRFAS